METKPINTKAATIALTLVALWGWFAWQSASQPFIPSDAYLNLLTYGVFPTLTIGCLCLIFRFKYPSTGITGWQTKTQYYSASKKIKTGIQLILLAPIFWAGFAYMLQWHPAFPTYLLSNQPTVAQVQVTELKKLDRSGRTKIYVHNLNTRQTYNLHWPTSQSQQITVGSNLTLKGKQNWFGRFIVQIVIAPSP